MVVVIDPPADVQILNLVQQRDNAVHEREQLRAELARVRRAETEAVNRVHDLAREVKRLREIVEAAGACPRCAGLDGTHTMRGCTRSTSDAREGNADA